MVPRAAFKVKAPCFEGLLVVWGGCVCVYGVRCVCMSVCVHTCARMCVCVVCGTQCECGVCICVHVCVCGVCVHGCVCVVCGVCVYECVCTHACVCVYECMCVYVYVHACMCACVPAVLLLQKREKHFLSKQGRRHGCWAASVCTATYLACDLSGLRSTAQKT